MARRGFTRFLFPARLNLQALEARLTPSFSLRAPLSLEDARQADETRAYMYTPLEAVPPSPTGADADLELRAFTPLRINLDDLTDYLANAPAEFEAGPA